MNYEFHPEAELEFGKTFVDPDGDPLQYSVTLASGSGDFHGAGTNVVGVPTHVGTAPTVTIEANDGRGGTVSDSVQIMVNANAKPAIARPNRVLLVQPGQHVDYDPTQGGAAFADADGDTLSYTTVAGVTPPGLSVVGGHVVGSLPSVGFATFEITASDGFGGTVVDKFGVAAVGPEPGRWAACCSTTSGCPSRIRIRAARATSRHTTSRLRSVSPPASSACR